MKLILLLFFTITAYEAATIIRGEADKSSSESNENLPDKAAEAVIEESAVEEARNLKKQSASSSIAASASTEISEPDKIVGADTNMNKLPRSLFSPKPNNFRRRVKGKAKIKFSVTDLYDLQCECPHQVAKKKKCCSKKNVVEKGKIGVSFDIVKCQPITPDGKPQNC